jgi:excisionase family DNA binding protein
MAVIICYDTEEPNPLRPTHNTRAIPESSWSIPQQCNPALKPVPEEKLWYSVAEVSTRLGLSRGVTYALIRSGQLKSIRVGGGKLIKVTHQALMAYLQCD